MWKVVNHTPFAVQSTFQRDKNGLEHWVTAIRATFRARPDGLVSVADQTPVLLAPIYDGANAQEMTRECDFAPFRPRCDVYIAGSACERDLASVRKVDVQVRVGKMEKQARVFGRRRLARAGTWRKYTIDVEPFTVAPLTWRSSLGGRDRLADEGAEAAHPANPIGLGWTASWLRLPGRFELQLPLVENPKELISLLRPLPRPHGFGPIQPFWASRVAAAGTYDGVWRKQRAPLAPLDFSDAFFQAAPADQVYPDDLRGGEEVSVTGMTPDGTYRFRLPQVLLDTRTRLGVERIERRARLIGIEIDGTDKAVAMVWNAAIPCEGKDHLIDNVAVSVRQMSGVAA